MPGRRDMNARAGKTQQKSGERDGRVTPLQPEWFLNQARRKKDADRYFEQQKRPQDQEWSRRTAKPNGRLGGIGECVPKPSQLPGAKIRVEVLFIQVG